MIFCKFCHVCKEECQSNTLLYENHMDLHGSAFLYMLIFNNSSTDGVFTTAGRDSLGLVALWPASSGRRGKHKICLCGSNFVKIAVFKSQLIYIYISTHYQLDISSEL